MKKRLLARAAALGLLALLAVPALALDEIDPSTLPGYRFHTYRHEKYQDESKYTMLYSDSHMATRTFQGLVPEEERNKLPILEGYSCYEFDLTYRDRALDRNAVEQFTRVYFPHTTALFENIVTNAPAGRELYITVTDGGETKRTERDTYKLHQTYSRTARNTRSSLSSGITVIYAGAFDFEWKHKETPDAMIARKTNGRAEAREILTDSGRVLPDSYIELTETKLDDERTMYTLYTVRHSEYEYVYENGSVTPTAFKVPEKRNQDEMKESWEIWTIYEPKDFPEIYFTLYSSVSADLDYSAPFGQDQTVFEWYDDYRRQVDEVINQAIRSLMIHEFIILSTDPYTPDGVLIEQSVAGWASGYAGEDEGVTVPDIIVLGFAGLAAAAAGAAAAGAGADGQKKRSDYKMTFTKDFGDTLDRDGKPQPVFVRMIEVTPDGFEIPRDELTAKVEAFSDDATLTVKRLGMRDGYLAVSVQVPSGTTYDHGTLSFRFKGKGGTFTRHIVFRIDEARIVFLQENLGLPAKYEKISRLPFVLIGLADSARVTAEIRRGEGENDVYAVSLQQDQEYKTLWYAMIREILPPPPAEGEAAADEQKDAGTTEAYLLHVTAETGAAGKEGALKKEADLPIYRVWLGLSMVVESTGIGCYMRVRPDRVGAKTITARDIEPCKTTASLLMLDWDEKTHSIVRAAVLPKMTEQEKKERCGIAVKVTPKRVENDRYAHAGDADENHQTLVDALGIKAFPTGETCANGACRLIFCSTKGALDPPTRMIAELEMTATYKGEDYTVKRDVLLRSQPFREAKSTAEENAQIDGDTHIRERLSHIQTIIWNNYMDRLFSLYNLIDRMLDGYDKRFGYDENQLKNVMEIWTGFLQGTHTGANGEGIRLTLADELNAAYAFMQGLRDNTGILGRIAMGVMTAGYSEYVFTAMTLGEEMRERVFACRGDEEFGCWDAVVMGVKEFEKQIIMEYAMMGAVAGAQQIAKETGGLLDVLRVAEAAGTKYRATIDRWDASLCQSSAMYKKGAEALQNAQNYYNSLARSANASLKESVSEAEQAAAKAEQKIAAGRTKMTPSELNDVGEYDLAMAEGLRKVQRLKEAQQKMAKSSDAEKELARTEYKRAADEVWTDKNALKQLQRSKDPYSQNMRYQFNEYREGTLNRVEQKALDDIAEEWGIPREELYVSNATSHAKADPYKVPGDRDTTFNRIVHSDRAQDISISQDWGERAMARNLYKELNGVDPPSIEEALRFMKAKDVSYVCPEGAYYMNHVIEPNLNAYSDLGGMIGLTKSGVIDKSLLSLELKGLALNRQTVAYKGKEWFTQDAGESFARAAECERAAASLYGADRESLLAEARTLRYTAQAQEVEGVRQITKQFDKIIDVRNTYSVARGNASAITAEIREIHAVAKRVGEDLSPAEFKAILREEYSLTLDGYADRMAQCLV